jgi:sporadic carbohydrate cluster protein (TIGR04323 family)
MTRHKVSMTERTGYRGYITSRSFLGERAPQHVQNLVIRDYAARNGLDYRLSATEYVMPGCFMMLEQVLDELPLLAGMICYSIFQLPPNATARRHIYSRIFESGGVFHAAVEGLAIINMRDVQKLEDIWRVRQNLDTCPTTTDIKAVMQRDYNA